MVDEKPYDVIQLSAEDHELKRFFDHVRSSRKIVVKDGEDEFIVELRRTTITDEARRRLTSGGPE